MSVRRLRPRVSLQSRTRRQSVRRWATEEVRRIADQASRMGTPQLSFVYANRSSPPTYGDLALTVLALRYWAVQGIHINFVLDDTGIKRADWSGIPESKHPVFVSEQVALAQRLLEGLGSVTYMHNDSGRESVLGNWPNLVGADLHAKRIPIYDLAPALASEAWRTFGQVPDFLLRPTKDVDMEVTERRRPYLAWHVRRGSWSLDRNSTCERMRMDLRSLASVASGRDIVLFSTPEGLDFALGSLEGCQGLNDLRSSGGDLLVQNGGTYADAVEDVIRADGYFQRAGGGMGVPLLFSSIPYVMIHDDDAALAATRRGVRVFPWSSNSQHFIVRYGDAARMSISRRLTVLAGGATPSECTH